jgi:hypothetical protein
MEENKKSIHDIFRGITNANKDIKIKDFINRLVSLNGGLRKEECKCEKNLIN